MLHVTGSCSFMARTWETAETRLSEQAIHLLTGLDRCWWDVMSICPLVSIRVSRVIFFWKCTRVLLLGYFLLGYFLELKRELFGSYETLWSLFKSL